MLDELTPRQKRIAIGALENAIEHEPTLRPVLVSDYANARLDLRGIRSLHETLQRRMVALSGHVDEPGSQGAPPVRPWTAPGSRSDVVAGDGPSNYGATDHTGFCDGVY